VKAIRVHETGEAEVLRAEDIPDPAPGPGQALIRVAATGVNFIEVYQRKGLYARPLPFTPGTEGAGTVVAVGRDVSAVRVGDRVVSTDLQGSYAQLALVAADRLIPVPEQLAFETAAAVMLQGMTAHYLATTIHPVTEGEWCLVHAAAGGVGLLLCQIARRRGGRVIGTVSNAEKAAHARAAGAHETIDYEQQDFVAEVRRITDGRGVRVVFDSVGRKTFDGSLDCLGTRGMMALFGQSSGPVPPFDPQILNRKGSLFLTRPTLAHYTASREELVARARDILDWCTDGSLRVRVDRTYPLDQAAAAQRALEQRETSGKVLLLPA
jgi:NADPH2:quinone reductase